MDFDKLYPGKFMKAADFGNRDVTLVISSVKHEDLGDDKESETKVIMAFSNAKKKLVLNKTNGTCIKAMFGRETDHWVGKRVTFFPAPMTDPFTGEKIIAIRVRGSPDLPQTTQFQANLGRKQVKFTLKKTAVGSGKASPAQPTPSPMEPEMEPGVDMEPPPEDAPYGEAP